MTFGAKVIEFHFWGARSFASIRLLTQSSKLIAQLFVPFLQLLERGRELLDNPGIPFRVLINCRREEVNKFLLSCILLEQERDLLLVHLNLLLVDLLPIHQIVNRVELNPFVNLLHEGPSCHQLPLLE